MSTNTTNVTFGAISSLTVPVNNSSDTSCGFDISADATITKGVLTGIHNGRLAVRDGSGTCDFNADANSSSFNFYGITDNARVSALQAINAFLSSASSLASTMPNNL